MNIVAVGVSHAAIFCVLVNKMRKKLHVCPCVLQNAWMATGDNSVCIRVQTSAVYAPSLMGYA
jgi:hypothetical protein